MHRRLWLILPLLLASLLLPSSQLFGAEGRQTSPTQIRVCVVVGSNPDAVVLQWLPMIEYLNNAVGRSFEIVIRDDYEDMLADYERGAIDMLISGPFNYVRTQERAGALLIAMAERQGQAKLFGDIIVRSRSGIRTIADLKGKSFAFSEPYSTTGYLLPRLLLAQQGIIQPADYFSKVIFAGHHTAVLEAVRTGSVDAGSLVAYFVDEALAVGEGLHVLATTPPQPSEQIFVRPDLDPILVRELRNALLSMDERVPPDVMQRLGVSRFVRGSDADYDTVRASWQQLKALPPIPYRVDYGLVPAALEKAILLAKKRGGFLLFSLPTAATLVVMLLFLLWHRRIRRDLRFKFAFSIFGAMLSIAYVVSSLSMLQLHRRLDAISLQWQRNIKIFTAQADKAASNGIELLPSLADGLAAQQGIRSVKIYRDGFYIADSDHRDTGHSIIPKILSDTFAPSAEARQQSIFAESYLMLGERRWATAQIALDRSMLREAIIGAVAGNLFAVSLLLVLGLALALFWSRAVTRPIARLRDAVEAIRAGRRPSFDVATSSDQIGLLLRHFQAMEGELRQTDELLRSKANELEETQRQLKQLETEDPDFEEEVEKRLEELPALLDERRPALSPPETALREKIAEIEQELPRLQELREQRIIGTAPTFLRVIRDIVIRSRDSEPVLLSGESGSGKTGVAQAIHLLGSRSEQPLVEYNCAELAASDPALVLGKLFGYGRDSGIPGVPKEGQRGLLEECDGTTLFLDEIALLPLSTQGVLLLPMEGRPFNPAAGKSAPRTVDVRFLFASNVRLEDEVRAGRFRNDLLRRIKARGCIEIPPLRNRMEDIEPLAAHFLKAWNQEHAAQLTFSNASLALLKSYDYHHFNIAELAIAVKVAADNAHFRGLARIEPDCFSDELAEVFRRRTVHESGAALFEAEEQREIAVLRRHAFRIRPSESELGYSPDAKTLTNHLRGIAFKVLAHVGGNIEEAARTLTSSEDSAVLERVRKKIDIYLKNVEKLAAEGDVQRLFNNLPQRYHAAVRTAIERTSRHRARSD